MRKLILVLVLITGAFFLTSCVDSDSLDGGSRTKEPTDNNDQEPELLQLTIGDLAAYDGVGDNYAYIAVNGVIYDVTNVSAWNGGEHNGNVAGTDVSDVINNAPHGDSVLENLTVVGEIIE